MDSPGAARGAYAVGATAVEQDLVTSFSSRGPVGFGSHAYAKPDIAAPGDEVSSESLYQYAQGGLTGTSFATPQVAGLAALLLQARPALAAGMPWSVTDIINRTAVDIGAPGHDNDSGWGRINVFEAVNSTGALTGPPTPPAPVQNLKHELYAGTLSYPTSYYGYYCDSWCMNWGWSSWNVEGRFQPTDNVPISVIDPSGDGAPDDLRGLDIHAPDRTGSSANFDFFLNESIATTLYAYIDSDTNLATGNGGADYRVVAPWSSDGPVAYTQIWNTTSLAWENTSTGLSVSGYWTSSFFVVSVQSVAASALGQPAGFTHFRVYAESWVAGVLSDRAPDSAWGAYPAYVRTVRASGFSWNQTSRAPESGSTMNFSLYAISDAKYNTVACHYYATSYDRSYCFDVLLNHSSVVTDDHGRAVVNMSTEANRSLDSYLVVIDDAFGNEVAEGFSPYLDSPQAPPPPPDTTTSYRIANYDYPSAFFANATNATLFYEIVDDHTMAGYNGHAQIRIVGDGPAYSSPELTVSNGRLVWVLNKSLLPDQQPGYLSHAYIYLNNYTAPTQVLGPTYVQANSATDNLDMQMLPEVTGGTPGHDSQFSLTLSNYTDFDAVHPRAGDVNVTVDWVVDSDVAGLVTSAPGSVLDDLMSALHAKTLDAARQIITPADRQAIRNFVKTERPANIVGTETREEVTVDARGVTPFNVHVPTGRVLFGFVDAEDALCDCSSESLILVPSTLSVVGAHHTAPQPNSDYDSVYPAVDWHPVGLHAPATYTVNVSFLHWHDLGNDNWVSSPVVGETVWLFTATGDSVPVVTDANGAATATFTAPHIDALNATQTDRYLDVWAVSRRIDPTSGNALVGHGAAYLWVPSVGESNGYSTLEGGVANGQLTSTVRWFDGSGNPKPHALSAINAFQSAGGSVVEAGEQLLTTLEDSDTGVFTSTEAVHHVGGYVVSADSGTLGERVQLFQNGPFNITMPSSFNDTYGTNAGIPIPIQVSDTHGNPVANADIWLNAETDNWCEPSLDDSGGQGGDALSLHVASDRACSDAAHAAASEISHVVTDGSGRATVVVHAPQTAYVWYFFQLSITNGTYLEQDFFDWEFQTVPGADLPNLVPSFGAIADPVPVGVAQSLTATVSNVGTRASSATSLLFKVNGVITSTLSVGALAAGASQSFAISFTPSAIATYTLALQVDPANLVAESLEDDNNVSLAMHATLPNLVAGPITLIGPVTVTGGVTYVDLNVAYTVRSTVRNTGSIAAGPSRSTITAGSATIATQDNTGLAPGESTVVSGSWTPTATGLVTLTAHADQRRTVLETNETDNTASRSATVINAPDLQLRVLAAPAIAHIGHAINYSFEVKNIGGITTNITTDLNVTIGDPVYTNLDVPPLDPGEKRVYNVTHTFDAIGSFAWDARVDPANLVSEFNEGNNHASGFTDAKATDLVVHLLASTDALVGVSHTVYVTVYNRGGLTSSPTTLTLRDSVGGTSLPDVGSVAIPALGPGEGGTHTFAWIPTPTGLHLLNASVPPASDDVSDGNFDTENVDVQAPYVHDLCLRSSNPVYPAPFTTTFSFSTNFYGLANFTLRGDGTVAAGEPTRWSAWVYPGNDWETFALTAKAVGEARINLTIELGSALFWQEIPGPCQDHVYSLPEPVIVKDTNSTVVESTGTATLNVHTFNITTFQQDFVADVKAGAQGRILAGLQFLTHFPNGCAEQTTSPTLAAYHIIEYYKARGVYYNASYVSATDRQTLNDTVLGGLARLTVSPIAQNDDGGWPMWSHGSPSINWYSAYVTHGLLTIRNDSIFTAAVDGSAWNKTRTPGYFAGSQKPDGSWDEGFTTWYLRSNVSLTSFIIKDLSELRPYQNATTKTLIDRVLANATDYLFRNQYTNTSQPGFGGWRPYGGTPDSAGGDPWATAYAVRGLRAAILSGALSPARNASAHTAADDGVTFLLAHQQPDGSWLRELDDPSYSYSFWTTSTTAEGTANALLALAESGKTEADSRVGLGVSFLYHVYRDGGSFGTTRSTMAAISALALLEQIQTIDSWVNLTVDGTHVARIHLTNDHADCPVQFDATGAPSAVNAGCDIAFDAVHVHDLTTNFTHALTFDVQGASRTLVAGFDRQTADFAEAKHKITATYIDPIASTFSLSLGFPSNAVVNQAATFTAALSNTDGLAIFSPAIRVPLGTNFASVAQAPTMTVPGGTAVPVNYEVNGGNLYIEPESVPALGTTSFSFKLTPLVSGAVSMTADAYPLYNDQLIAPASATGTVLGFGTLAVVASGGTPTVTVDGTSLGGVSGSVLEGTHAVTVGGAGDIPATLSVTIARDATTTLHATLTSAATSPTVVLTSASSAAIGVASDVTDDANYTRTITSTYSSSGGNSIVAFTVPADHTFRSATFAGSSVTPTVSGSSITLPILGAASGTLVILLDAPDHVPPVVTPVAPVAGSTITSGAVPITASFSDHSFVNGASLSFVVDGADVTGSVVKTPLTGSLVSATYVPNPTLAAGLHSVTVSVADVAGNVGTATWSFTVASAISVIGSGTNLIPASTSGGSSSAGSPGTLPAGALSVGDLAAGQSASVPLDSGDFTDLALSAVNSVKDVSILVTPVASGLPPGVTSPAPGTPISYLGLSALSNGTTLPSSSFDGVEVHVAVPKSVLDSLQYTPGQIQIAEWTGVAWKLVDVTLSTTGLDKYLLFANLDGVLPLAILAKDSKGPTIASVTPDDGSTTSSASVAVSYTDDSFVDPTSVVLTVDGVNVVSTITASGLTATLPALAPGPHTLHITVSDVHGNAATKTWTFTFGSGSLVVTIDAPAANGAFPTQQIHLLAHVPLDAGVLASGVTVTLDGAPISADLASNGSITGDFTATEGFHTLVVTVKNALGTTGTATSRFAVDLTPPTLAPNLPSGKAKGSVDIPTGAADAIGVDHVDILIDGKKVENLTAAPWDGTIDTTKLSDGTHRIQIATYDRAGHVTYSNTTLDVQNAAKSSGWFLGLPGFAVAFALASIVGGALVLRRRKRGSP
ncbi:MAG: CARDB domain-containing protein [Thermoplasmatota archaeon]